MKENLPQNLPQPGEKYEIPVHGSLGLLALGYRGLLLWRKKRAEFETSPSASGSSSINPTQHEGK